MATIMDYVHWRGDLSFTNAPFTIIDNLIFSELVYIDYQDCVPSYPSTDSILYRDAMEKVFALHEKEKMVLGAIVPQTIVHLADLVKDDERFGTILVSNYTNIIDIDTRTQFSAMCFHLPNDEIFIAYRGTDDTLIGWQENVDMLYQAPVGAQVMALDYLQTIAELFPNSKIYMGGHSKGGNLANYAAIYAPDDIKERLIYCYSNDGQGMQKKLIDKEEYQSIKKKIIRIIPESSVVGMIFDPFAGHTVVCKSSQKGIYQHDGFSWQIRVVDFEAVPDVTDKAKKLDRALTKMFLKISDDEKRELGRNLYDFIIASQLNTLLDCKKESVKLLKYLNRFSGKSKQIFLQVFGEFIFY